MYPSYLHIVGAVNWLVPLLQTVPHLPLTLMSTRPYELSSPLKSMILISESIISELSIL